MGQDCLIDTLVHVLANQGTRWRAALADLPEEVFMQKPGGDCNSILDIGRHMVRLRRFQLNLLGESADAVPDEQGIGNAADLVGALALGETQVRAAIERHDPDDWFRVPETPREGPWGELSTMARFVRPLNDFTNHLGGIRAIRRIAGCPAEQVQ